LSAGFGAPAILAGLLYCFVAAAFAEELLFRGVIAKRCIHWLGFRAGNVVQATIFWLMHLWIVHWVTGAWISGLQAVAFVTSFGLALVGCYWNERRAGGSLVPSWLFHAGANFATFLTLAAV
jgi:membrane protease YdiL (CAAX protease family)